MFLYIYTAFISYMQATFFWQINFVLKAIFHKFVARRNESLTKNTYMEQLLSYFLIYFQHFTYSPNPYVSIHLSNDR